MADDSVSGARYGAEEAASGRWNERLTGDHGLPGRDWAASEWSVPWSDLMMVMFVLFAVLFAHQLANPDTVETFNPLADIPSAQPSPPPGPTPGPAPSVLLSHSERAVRETDLEDVDVELQADQSIKVSVKGPMFFDLGRAELRPRTMEFLDRIAEVIRRTEYEVDIIGHTDSHPVSTDRYPTNWELSALRATAVTRYLIERAGLAPGRFTVMGRSMYRPRAPNTTDNNQAMNRRVEIVITRRVYMPAEVNPS